LRRDTPELEFDFLPDLTAVDYPSRPKRFDVVYHLYSMTRNHRLRLKAAVGEGEAIDSVWTVWKASNWEERECFDMFGIVFTNHPDMRRILLRGLGRLSPPQGLPPRRLRHLHFVNLHSVNYEL